MNQGQPQDKAHGEQDYLAFISYRHADNSEEDQQWATWLHQQLEVYDVPDDLIGTPNLRGEIVPERIYPVFRDEVSLPADADLSHAISQALDQSRFLIVLCSPRVVQSRYVNEEILHFKSSGKQDRIMAALILGEPNASIDPHKTQDPEHANTLECFPPALQYHVTADGQLDKSKPTEPIAANFRLPDGGKGLTNPNVYKQHLLKKGRNKKDADRLAHLYEEQVNNARLKIIAGILGVPLERLTQRDKIHQLNKARAATQKFRRIAVGMGTLALAALIATCMAILQRQQAKIEKERAEKFLNQITDNLNFMNFELRDVLGKYVPQHEKLNILKKIDTIVDTLQQHSGQTAEGQRQIAVALQQKADAILVNEQLDPKEAFALYQKSYNISLRLAKQSPGNSQFQRDLLVAYSKLGDIQLRLGKAFAALHCYQLVLELVQRLVKEDPGNTQFQRDMSMSYSKLGDVQLSLGQTDAALKFYQSALDNCHTLVKQDSDNIDFQRDLSVSYAKLGDVQLRLGHNNVVLKFYQLALDSAQALVKQNPGDIDFQRDMSISYSKLGDIQLRLGQTEAASKSYHLALDSAQALVKRDPGNNNFQRDLSISYYKLAQIYYGNNDSAHAKVNLKKALSIIMRMQKNGFIAQDDEGFIQDIEWQLKTLAR